MKDGRRFARLSLVLGVFILLAGTYYEPWVYVWAGSEAEGRLAACGGRAIRPMIWAIRERGAPGYPRFLATLGEPARKALQEAVEAEADPAKKSRLAGALKEAFGS